METFTNAIPRADLTHIKYLPKTFFLNYIFIFIQFRFLRSFSLTFISILNCLRSRDEPQEDINQYRVQEGTSKLIFLCLIALAKFQSAMRAFYHPTLVDNYQTLYIHVFAPSIV